MTRAFAVKQSEDIRPYIADVIADYPASPAVGDLIRVGDMIGYALQDEDSDGKTITDFGPMQIEGSVTAAAETAITPGTKIYFADAASPLSNTSTSAKFCGYALGSVAAGATGTIRILKAAAGGA